MRKIRQSNQEKIAKVVSTRYREININMLDNVHGSGLLNLRMIGIYYMAACCMYVCE